jgi:tripartite-type tricarboxylate transporter receptor subunit TctC
MTTKHLFAAALLLVAAPAALAQVPYPSQQIKIICPFPAGGGTDLTSRLLGEQLSKTLGQPFVVENRTGASGMIGTGAPDSDLLLCGASRFYL